MDMNSFVVNIGEFFLKERYGKQEFINKKKQYVIPKYQREYKWTPDRVKTLISDINNRDKFLGIIILNEISDEYEIVDGQQRLTTIMLILATLFNKNRKPEPYENERSEEQRDILRYIYDTETRPVIRNDSIGEYLQLSDTNLKLTISEEDDIYYQKATFDNIFKEIEKEMNDEIHGIKDITSFQKKVLDCQVLILVGKTGGRQNDSVEDVFLDINYKTQVLDAADNFKGYCFKIYSPAFHDELKDYWVQVKRCAVEFNRIGYKDTCEYIYHYLLSCPDAYNISEKLTVNGKHYLEDKKQTETKNLLQDMGNYGRHILELIKNLSDTTYIFEDICSDGNRYKNDWENHRIIKHMLSVLMCNKKVQYYKLPLFMVIHFLRKNEGLKAAFTYEDLKKFVANYYAYAFFFISGSKSKSKASIDKTIFSELYKIKKGADAGEVVKEILRAAKKLRMEYLEGYQQSKKFVEEKAEQQYSIMDHYNANKNFISLVYCKPDYTREHLIIHGNSQCKVAWEEKGNSFSIVLKDLLGQMDENKYRTAVFRDLTCNSIILPYRLNENLGHMDIVEKIKEIKYYFSREPVFPKHVKIFIEHIERLEEYKTLVDFKGQSKTKEEIEEAYVKFVNTYFSEEIQNALYDKLEYTIRKSFQNSESIL